MSEIKQLELAELRVNMKIHIRSLTDEKGFVMIVHQINGTEITAVLRRSAIGSDPSRFTFYSKGAQFMDGTGKTLLVARFKR